jgi:hypothetical protein
LAELAETDADRVGVVLPTFGFEQYVQRHIRVRSGNDQLDVVTPRDLGMRRPYDLLCIVGSPAWYVRKRWGWVYTAPRASQLVVIGYEAQASARLPSVQAFTRSQLAVRPAADEPKLAGTSERQAEAYEAHDESEVDWGFVTGEVARRTAGAHPTDLVEARLYLLASGCATFLQTSNESRVPTVELDAPEGSRLVYVPVPEIGPGSVVLLRSEGGGDLVVAVADAILSSSALSLREMEAE